MLFNGTNGSNLINSFEGGGRIGPTQEVDASALGSLHALGGNT